ncbi:palmitoyltransferase ZDHHC6 [Neocloeon triangulifer]|uniref:palmitoyltransferase ZDHHC6 n=1 Tax=Neocloeon triangulifer TaxID=2078957 RepID=UPI00286F8F5D|nr:palmitoyltransferase ZDHHC6 [Neocloeon triangulifer]
MCIGPLKRICHWGPVTALAIIKSIVYMTVYCNRMWWPPDSSAGGALNFLLFILLSGLTIFNFLSAVYVGPGFLPNGWCPENESDAKYLQECKVCGGFKAPRSHHCRKCNRCVTKMDHHCPWINNCVGHRNHGHFTAFLFFAVLGCLQSSLVLTCTLYHALHRVKYAYYGGGPIITFTLYGLVGCVFCLGLAIGVVLAVGMLLYFQMRAIIRNQTAIEDWILEKAKYRRLHSEGNRTPFVYPYNLGCWKNLRQVITLTCEPVGDGVEWPVVEGCDQYTFTVEQLLQKQEKRQRARKYEVLKNYSGAWLPISHGLYTLFCPPYSDEPRLRLRQGNVVLVTRWKKHWLFGELELASEHGLKEKWRLRGWFPRNIAVDLIDATDEEDEEEDIVETKKKK